MRMASGLGDPTVWGRGDEVGAVPTVETGMQEAGARPLDKAGFDGLASVLVPVACPSSGIHPNWHGEMKNRTLKD